MLNYCITEVHILHGRDLFILLSKYIQRNVFYISASVKYGCASSRVSHGIFACSIRSTTPHILHNYKFILTKSKVSFRLELYWTLLY